MTDTASSPLEAFSEAIAAQRRLQDSLIAAGLHLDEFPQMVADVNPLGEPRVVLGGITTTTAERLAHAIHGPGKTKRR